MKVSWADTGRVAIPRPAALARLAARILAQEGFSGAINLVFCENDYIRDLNKRFRKLDKVTDVLSFHYGEKDIFGEVYIASEQAKKQAPRWKNTFYTELKRLVTHGSLHLAGYDHMNPKDRKRMRAKEDFYLA